MKPVIIVALIGAFGISLGFSLDVSAEEGLIPTWIKNTTGYWVDGAVGDSEFISALQYLISHDIIKVPITEVIASTSNLEDKDRAMSLVVHFSDAQFSRTLSIYTFSTFFHFSPNVGSTTPDITRGLNVTPVFTLQSIPSKDKLILYEFVEKYITAHDPERFSVVVDIVSGDGEIIQSWDYRKCSIADYSTFVDSSKENYRFSDTDDLEIRELFVFACSGYNLRV